MEQIRIYFFCAVFYFITGFIAFFIYNYETGSLKRKGEIEGNLNLFNELEIRKFNSYLIFLFWPLFLLGKLIEFIFIKGIGKSLNSMSDKIQEMGYYNSDRSKHE